MAMERKELERAVDLGAMLMRVGREGKMARVERRKVHEAGRMLLALALEVERLGRLLAKED